MVRFCHTLTVRLTREFVGLGGGAFFFQADLGFLLAPTLVDRLQAPLGAFAGRADGFIRGEDEDGIGVRGGQDAQRDPTAACDVDVKRDGAELTVGGDFLARYRFRLTELERLLSFPSSRGTFSVTQLGTFHSAATILLFLRHQHYRNMLNFSHL